MSARLKSVVLFICIVAAALNATATDRFYIEDFAISSGDTQMLSILLDNEAEYTAFQVDIYIPEGLFVEQEDGEFLFDLTSRKGRDHTITSLLRPDGAIRLIAYSVGVKPFSGKSGALVTFNINANELFSAPATIYLKNILFTTTLGEEIAFADETCIVSSSNDFLIGDVDGDGRISIDDVTALIDILLRGNQAGGNPDVDCDGRVSIDDVTALIDLLLVGPKD